MLDQEGDANGFRNGRNPDGMQPRRHGLWFKCFVNRAVKARLARCLAVLFVLLAALGIGSIALAEAEQGVQYAYNRTIGLRKVFRNVVKTAAVTDIRVCACQPDRVDRVLLQNGFETTISIYDRGESDMRPGIVLIHGNVWMGQRLSTYRLVAHFLAEEGFIVLTFDKVGFGESDDPFGQGPAAVAAAYDRVGQVGKAVEYLIDHTDVDPDNITLLGHSGGVTQALELGHQSNRISAVVAWVAPYAPADESDIPARLAYLDAKFRARYELIYGRSIPDWFEWDLTGIGDQGPDAWEYYRQHDHKQLILVLGENDQPDAHPHVFDLYETLTEPKDLIFVRRADHYLNTAQSLRWVFYDQDIVSELVDGLVASLSKCGQS